MHLIVKEHEGGFFSNFNKVITFLNETPIEITKIKWDLQGKPFGAFAYNCGEVFGKLFMGDNVIQDKQHFTLNTYTTEKYTGRDVQKFYESSDRSWRYSLNKTLRKYISPTPVLARHIDKINKSNFKNCIGILKRNELLKCEQPNNIMPTLESYFKEIDLLFTEDTYLYLSVDNYHDLNAFIKRYGRCIYNPKIRRTQLNTDMEPHFLPGTELDAVYTYIDVYCLSLCHTFLHPISNMATASLYHNPEQRSIFL